MGMRLQKCLLLGPCSSCLIFTSLIDLGTKKKEHNTHPHNEDEIAKASNSMGLGLAEGPAPPAEADGPAAVALDLENKVDWPSVKKKNNLS